MHYVSRLAQLSLAALLGLGSVAFAQETPESPPQAAPAGAAPATSDPYVTPAPTDTNAAAATEETPVVAPAAMPVDKGRFGFAIRERYVFVPGWFLGLFAEKNMPMSTFKAFAVEGFWRKRDKEDPNRTWEIVVSGGYQNMSPPDGIWLGRGKDINQDADLVQARGLGLITFDAAYVLRQFFSPYFGIHYGAGLGLGIVRGKVLRTSALHDPATGKTEVVVSGVCGGANPPCTEAQLKATEANPPDTGPYGPHRYQEASVPSAVPIINLLFGIDFRIPISPTRGDNIDLRLETGFYDAFFVGATVGYVL
jgi:hypothetical protein